MVDFGLEVEGRRLERVVGGKREGEYEGSALRLKKGIGSALQSLGRIKGKTNGIRRVLGTSQLDLPFVKVGVRD